MLDCKHHEGEFAQCCSDKQMLEEQNERLTEDFRTKNDELEGKLIIIAENVQILTKSKDLLMEENYSLMEQIKTLSAQKSIEVDMNTLLLPCTVADNWVNEMKAQQSNLIAQQLNVLKMLSTDEMLLDKKLSSVKLQQVMDENTVLMNTVDGIKTECNHLKINNRLLQTDLESAKLKCDYSRRCIIIDCVTLHDDTAVAVSQ